MSMIQCPECSGTLSDKACTCPHCGYPVRPVPGRQRDYILSVGHETIPSSFSYFLRILGILVWIAGLIIAIIAGQMSYRFSFAQFLIAFIPYIIYGFVLCGLGSVCDEVHQIHSIVSGIRLESGDPDAPSGSAPSKRSDTYFSRPKLTQTGKWVCKNCGTENASEALFCKDCGKYK